MLRFLKFSNIYVFLLFVLPSVLITSLLIFGYDLPRLSALSSERFWVYLVESKRAISNGVFSWPGNVESHNESWLYLERFLIRFLYLPVNSKLYLVVDAVISSLCLILGLSYVIKKYYSAGDKYLRFAVILLVAVQPIYLVKALVYDSSTIDLWFGRGLVASASLVVFLIGLHELIWRKNLLAASICGFLLGLIHFYSFLLFLGTVGIYCVYLGYGHFVKAGLKGDIGKQYWLAIFITVACIFMLLINTLIFKSALDLQYFFNRYIPSKANHFEVFGRDVFYLAIYAAVSLMACYKYVLSAVERRLNSLLLLTIASALTIDIGFLIVAPEAINIHFRIYIIEPLFLIFIVVFLRQRSQPCVNAMIFFAVILSVKLLFNQYTLLHAALNLQDAENESVHAFLYNSSLDSCQCTIFDPDTAEFLQSKTRDIDANSYLVTQWQNSILHLGRFYE